MQQQFLLVLYQKPFNKNVANVVQTVALAKIVTVAKQNAIAAKTNVLVATVTNAKQIVTVAKQNAIAVKTNVLVATVTNAKQIVTAVKANVLVATVTNAKQTTQLNAKAKNVKNQNNLIIL